MSADQVLGLLNTLTSRLEDVTQRLEKLEVGAASSSAGASSSGGAGLPQSVADWRGIMDTEVQAFTSAAAAIGGDAQTAAANVLAALKECGELIEMASVCAKPADVQSTVASLSSAMGKVNNQDKPRDRKDPAFMIIDLVQGAIPSLGWVVTDAQAWSTVDMNVEVMRFTGDKILTTYRRSDPKMIAFENTFSAIWKKVSPYVKEHHPAGLKWQQGGISTDKYQKGMVGSGDFHNKPLTPMLTTPLQAQPPPPPLRVRAPRVPQLLQLHRGALQAQHGLCSLKTISHHSLKLATLWEAQWLSRGHCLLSPTGLWVLFLRRQLHVRSLLVTTTKQYSPN